MTNPIRLSGLAAFAALAGAIAASAGPRDPLYQWTDERGAIRYTSDVERIPAEQRSAATVIAAGHGGTPAVAPPATQPPVAQQPAAQPSAPAAAPVESAPPPGATAAPTDPKLVALDARIAELEQKIAADEAALGDYISDPERAAKQSDSGDVAAIADRLPKLQSELRELRVQRDAAAGAAAAPNAAP
jgi:hypothetical protein